VYVYDTTDIFRVFDGRLTYNKGGAVLHTLRFLIGDDSLFFRSLRDYLHAHAFGTAGTEDLKQSLERSTGRNLDTFFRQWIYGEGFPVINLKWNRRDDDTVLLQISQQGSVPGSVPFFSIPLELQLLSSQGDTVIRIQPGGPEMLYSFTWRQPVEDIRIDPRNWLPDSARVTRDPFLLDPGRAAGDRPLIYPNPSSGNWRIAFIPPGTILRLLNVSGQTLLRMQVAETTAEIQACGLAPGVYLLELYMPDGSRQYRKLIHQ